MFCLTINVSSIIQKLQNKHTFLKSIETEKAKSSHFDRMRGDKNQIFPTLVIFHENLVVAMSNNFVLINEYKRTIHILNRFR